MSEAVKVRWVVMPYDNLGDNDCVVVEAATEDEAAVEGANALVDLWSDNESDLDASDMEHVFVAPWDVRTAYVMHRTFVAERSPMQCCGGPSPAWVRGDGHWGGCRVNP